MEDRKDGAASSEVQSLAHQVSEAAEVCSERVLNELERLKQKSEENYAAGLLEVKALVAAWHSLLDVKEVELLQSVEETRAGKMAAFGEREAHFTELVDQAMKFAADVVGSEPPSEEQVAQGHSLLDSLSLPLHPHQSHITAHPGLGFCPNIKESITQALSLGMWVSGEDVRVGERMVVSAVGGLQPDGTFWVRRVTSDPWKQEYALQHISNSLSEVPQSYEPLGECTVGRLCVGQFSQDGRWYRAVVTSIPRPGVAKYFFLDHGGSEEAPVSSLYPLPDHFRALPFQMIHVRLTVDTAINFNTREMRWRFTDFTHKKQLVAEIIGQSRVEEGAGPVYLVSLEDHSQEEVFVVGEMLVTAAMVKETGSKFKSRDVRFKDKRASALQATPTATPTLGPASDTTTASPHQAQQEEEEKEKDGEEVSDQRKEEEEEEEEEEERVGDGASNLQCTPGDREIRSAADTSAADPSPHTITQITPSPVTQGTDTSAADPSPHTITQITPSPVTQTAAPSLISSPPPPILTPSQQDNESPNSQLPPHSMAGLDSVPHVSHSNTTPYDSGTDTIPPDSSPDSIPPKQVPSPDTIPESQKEPHSVPKPEPLQLCEAEGVLLSNAANDDKDGVVLVDAMESLHPSVKIGERLEVEVVTELSPDGEFWCQLLLSSEERDYEALQEQLQAGREGEREAFTPVFYHEGEICLAQFSEDENWYRARIERVDPGMPHMTFLVRYVDFGNNEESPQHLLMPLGSEFRLLPPRAVCCNLATKDHASFTRAECEKFDQLAHLESLFIEVLDVEEEGSHQLRVRLLQMLPNSAPLDLREKILPARNPKVTRRQWSSSTDLEAPNVAHVVDWASHMEEDQQDDCVFLTLPGHESREATPLSREATPTNDRGRKATPTSDVISKRREATPSNYVTAKRREATPTKDAISAERKTNNVASVRREATPTNDVISKRREATPSKDVTAKRREATPSKDVTAKRREATPTNDVTAKRREATPTNDVTAKRRDATPTNDVTAKRREATPTNDVTAKRREATPTKDAISAERKTTSISNVASVRREATPTNDVSAATPTNDVIHTNTTVAKREATPTQQDTTSDKTLEATSINQRGATPTPQEAPPTQWVPLVKQSFLQRVPTSGREGQRSSSGRQARLDLNKAKHSIFASLGAKNVPRPLRHDDPVSVSVSVSADVTVPPARGRARHPKQESLTPSHPHSPTQQGKLYVKCPPEDMSDSKLKELFGRYGDVLNFDPHTTDPSIVYLTMDVKGAEEAVVKLNGYKTSSTRHLVVEKYRVHSPSPPPPSLSHCPPDLTGMEHVKLFVKNVSSDHNLSSLRTVFGRYGRVLKMVPDPKRRTVTYIYMDMEGGAKAINNLHGKAISKNGKPLIVELSYQPKNR